MQIVGFFLTLAACAKNFHTNPIVLYLKSKLKVIITDPRKTAYTIPQISADFFSSRLFQSSIVKYSS